MATRMRLTETSVRKLRPENREFTVWDTRLAGFGVRVRTTGQKSFVFHWSKKGKAHRVTIGTTSLMSMDQALAKCTVLQAELHGGNSPKVAGDEPRMLLFRDFIAGPWKTACYDRYKKSTRVTLDSTLRTQLLPAFGSVPLDRIDKASVIRWFTKYGRKAPGGANRALEYLHQIMNKAVADGIVSKNPASKIQKNTRRKMNRFLSAEEIQRLNQALDQWEKDNPQDVQKTDIVRLLMLTGCRYGEILHLKWCEVLGDTLHLTDAKTGPRRVFLNITAQALIARQPQKQGSGWVFPSPRDPGKPRGRVDNFWYSIRRRVRIEDVRLHDLRHTVASQAVLQGIPLPVVARLLGHSRATMTLRVYSHVADNEVEAAAERIGDIVNRLIRVQ